MQTIRLEDEIHLISFPFSNKKNLNDKYHFFYDKGVISHFSFHGYKLQRVQLFC